MSNNLRIELHNTNLPAMLLSHCILKCFFYKQFVSEFCWHGSIFDTHAHRSVKMASYTACYPLHARVVSPPCCDFIHKESFIHPTCRIRHTAKPLICVTVFLIFQLATSTYFPQYLFFSNILKEWMNEWLRFSGFGYTVCWSCSTSTIYIAGFTLRSKLNGDIHFPHLIY